MRIKYTKTPIAVVTLFFASTMAISARAETADIDPSALVRDQQARDQSITIDYLYLPQNGYAAVYQSDDQGVSSGAPIGQTSLNAGDHRGINIDLSEQPKSGQKLWISLYRDADGRPTFDPGKGDVAVWSKGQLPTENAFVVR